MSGASCACSSIPSATVRRPNERASSTIARTSARLASGAPSWSTNVFGIFSMSSGSEAR